jgi:hypothetical protein
VGFCPDCSGSNDTNRRRLYRYDAATDTWARLADCPVPHIFGAGGVIDGNCVAAPFRAVVTNNALGVEIERSYTDGVFNDTGHAVVFTFADFGPPFGYCVSEVSGALSADW